VYLPGDLLWRTSSRPGGKTGSAQREQPLFGEATVKGCVASEKQKMDSVFVLWQVRGGCELCSTSVSENGTKVPTAARAHDLIKAGAVTREI
jgi:hypothetical protein